MALTALPVLVFAVQDPVTVNGRTAQTLILTQQVSDAEKLRQIWDTVQRHALMFNVSGGGDLNGRHNLPGAPMLDPLTGPWWRLGLGWLLIRPRDWRTLMLLGWSAVFDERRHPDPGLRSAPGGAHLRGDAGSGGTWRDRSARLARPRARPGDVAAPSSSRARTIAIVGLGALAVAWIGWSNLDTYFNRQMRECGCFNSFSTREDGCPPRLRSRAAVASRAS